MPNTLANASIHGSPKDKEKVFHKGDMFSIPSTMKSGKNINLQTSPKLKMKVGV